MEKSKIRVIEKEPFIVHCSSLTILEDGTRLAVWYEGLYETSPDTVLRFASMQAGSSWVDHASFSIPGVPLGNPVLFRPSFARRVYLVYSVLLGEAWDESLLCWSHSDDDGKHWSDPILVRTQKGLMAKTHPVFNDEGRLLLPLYNHTQFCPYLLVVKDLDHPTQALLTAETMARNTVIQPAIAPIGEKEYIMLARTNAGTIWRSISSNNGYSWTIFQSTPVPNPNSAIDVTRTQAGEHVLVFNPSSYDRKKLVIALSQDGLKTLAFLYDIEVGEGEYSYPSLAVTSQTHVEITYTIDRHTISWCAIQIDEIKNDENRLDSAMSLGF